QSSISSVKRARVALLIIAHPAGCAKYIVALTTLPRSARSRVSSTRSFERPTRTPSPPSTDSYQHGGSPEWSLPPLTRKSRAKLGALPRVDLEIAASIEPVWKLRARKLTKLVAPRFSFVDASGTAPVSTPRYHRAYRTVTIAGSFLTRISEPRTGAGTPSTVAESIGWSSGL